MNIDHHIQQSIIDNLISSDEGVSYTKLKQADIENSLFSYHLNKLIDRGMVVKNADGYTLTKESARWLHFNGPGKDKTSKPRVFVSLIIKDQKNHYLIGQRSGQFHTLINDYVLPGVYYVNDQDLPTQINQAITEYIPEHSLLEQHEFGFVQFKARYTDKSLDSLTSLTLCHTKEFEVQQVRVPSNFEWMTIQQIKVLNHPSAQILREMLSYVENPQNVHTTPLLAG